MIPPFLFCSRSKNEDDPAKKNGKPSVEDQKLMYFEKSSLFKVYAIVMTIFCILLTMEWLHHPKLRKDRGFPEVNWTLENMILAPLYCIIIIALLYVKYHRFSLIVNTLSAVALMRLLISLEIMFHRRESLVSFLIMIVIFRLMERKTIYDNFALCVAYTSDIVSINRKQFEWYYLSNLFVWTYFGVAMLILFVFRRLAIRMWEHIRVLLILRTKTLREKQLGNYVIDSHMPEDILTHLFPLMKKRPARGANPLPAISIVNLTSQYPLNRSGSSNTVTSATSAMSELTEASTASPPPPPAPAASPPPPFTAKRDVQAETLQGLRMRKAPNGRVFVKHIGQRVPVSAGVTPTNRRNIPRGASGDEERSIRSGALTTSSLASQSSRKGTSDEVLRPASKAKVVSQFADAKLSLTQLEAIGGMDRRETVLIAIKPDMSTFDSALSQLHFHAFVELIDYVASLHKITRIRMLGNIWVGCLGVFQSHESSSVDCQHAVVFASEVTVLAGEFYGKVTYAVEFGRILCGFVNSVNFDVFGQEIRWILMMIELKEYGKIALGDAAKKQLHLYRKQVLESNAFNAAMNRVTINMSSVKIVTLEPIAKDQPWTTDSKITVNYVTNPHEMIDEAQLLEYVHKFYSTTREQRGVFSDQRGNAVVATTNPDTSLLAAATGSTTDTIVVPTTRRPRPLPFGLTYNHRPQLGWDFGEVLTNIVYDNTVLRLLTYLGYSSVIQVIDVGGQSEVDWFKFQEVMYGDATYHKILSVANRQGSSSKSINLSGARTPLLPRAYLKIEDRMSESKRMFNKYSVRDASVDHTVGKQRLKTLFNNSYGLGVEFLTTIEERYGIQLDDPVLDHLSEEELIKAHKEIEREVYRIIANYCFRIAHNAVFMVNYYTDVYGRNEVTAVRGRFGQGLQRLWDFSGRMWAKVKLVLMRIWNGPPAAPPNVYAAIPRNFPAGIEAEAAEPDSSRFPSFRSKPSPQASVSFQNSMNRILPIVSPLSEPEEKEQDSIPFGAPVNKPLPQNTVPSDGHRHPTPARYADLNAFLYAQYKNMLLSPYVAKLMIILGIEYRAEGDEPQVVEEEELKRSWRKYSSDIRMFTYSWWVNSLISVILTGVALYAIHDEVFEDENDCFWVVLLGGIHLILPILLDRQYDRVMFTGLLAMCVFIYLFFPTPLLCRSDHHKYLTSKHKMYFGDSGGDVTVLLITAIRIAAYARHSAWQTGLDWLLFRNFIIIPHKCDLTSSAILTFFLFNLQIVILFHLIEHRSFVMYIVEHKMVAFAHKSYLEQIYNSRRVLQLFTPGVPRSDLIQDDLYVPRLYHNCLIVAIHIKAPDILSSIIEPAELVVIMKTINQVIDGCIADCGMLKVTQFSGISIAVACKDFKWDGGGAMKYPENHERRGLALAKRLEEEIKRFNERYEFNLSLGMGINRGSVTLGLHGSYRHCFDVSGPAVDMACAMACFHGDKIFLKKPSSSVITAAIQDSGEGSSSSSDMTTEQRAKDAAVYKLPSGDWVPIGINGMQGIGLNDFEHLKMLGKGGYGSVHLVKEKQTKENYAIKVIPLNAGPIIPKMITRECIILQMMHHPNVVSLECAFTHKEKLYLVMKYIRGGTLKEILEYGPDKGSITLDTKKLWFAELVLAIEYVHTMGIIHRDVKPANCMIGTDGHLRLADFGLSKKIGDNDVALMTNTTGVNAADLEHMALRVRNRYNPIAESLGLTREAFFKIQKFLPLKLSNKPNPGQVFRFLSVSPEFRTDGSLFFHGFTVEVVHVQSIADALAVVHDEFAAVCIEIDAAFPVNGLISRRWEAFKDGPRLVQEYFAVGPRDTPVFVITKNQLKRKSFAGVKDFWTTPVENCSEAHFIKICGIQAAALPASETVLLNDRPSSNVGEIIQLPNTNRFGPTRISNSKANSAVGTMHFIAPEVLKLSTYSKPVDWWACGITIYECMVGEHVFAGEDRSGVVGQITSGTAVNLTKLRAHGDAVYRLVHGLLLKDWRERLGSQNVESIKSQDFFHGIDWLAVSHSTPDYMPNTFEHPRTEGDAVLFRGDEKESKVSPRSYDALDEDIRALESHGGNQSATRKQYARSNVNKYKQRSKLKQHHRTKQQQGLFHAPASAAKTALVTRNVQHNMALSEEEFNRTREGYFTTTVNVNKIEEEDERDVLEECSTDTGLENHSLKKSPQSGIVASISGSNSGSIRLSAKAAGNALLESSMKLEDHLSEEVEAMAEKYRREEEMRNRKMMEEEAKAVEENHMDYEYEDDSDEEEHKGED